MVNQAMEPADGWYLEKPMEWYLAIPLVSSGLCKKMRRETPANVYRELHGTSDSEEKAHYRLGEVVHTAVLEPDWLPRLFVQKPEPDPEKHTTSKGAVSSNPANTSAYKEEVAALQAENPDAKMISAAEYGTAMAMRDAVQGHSRAAALIAMDGPVEASICWTDPETGVRCKIRPDKLVEPIKANLQVKTTRNPGTGFPWELAKFGYHISEAFYMRGLKAAGWDPRHSFILAIPSEGPVTSDNVCVYELDSGTLDAGDQLVSRYLRQIAYCFDKDLWPGLPGDSIPLISLPDREWNRVSDELTDVPPYLPYESLNLPGEDWTT